MKKLIILITLMMAFSGTAFAEEYLSCDLSVSDVRAVMDFEPEYGEYENVWDSRQWFSVYASNKGVLYPKDRLEKEQFKDIKKDGYDRYYNDMMVQTSIPQLGHQDRALALRQGSIRHIEEDGEYAIIKSKQVSDSTFIDVLIYKNNKVVMSGQTILSADKHRVFLIGESAELTEIKEKHPDMEEIDMYQMIKQGSLVSYYMNCTRR